MKPNKKFDESLTRMNDALSNMQVLADDFCNKMQADLNKMFADIQKMKNTIDDTKKL